MQSRILRVVSLLFAWACLPLDGADAAIITTQEAGLDSIFSQSTFADDPIDIRFTPSATIVDPELITIDSPEDFNQLWWAAPNPLTHVNLFFVDQINWCGAPGDNFAGCGTLGGYLVTVDSFWAASPYGAELIAHEIGHNLGLEHTAGTGLMGPTLNGDATLSAAEVTTIRTSPLVQTDLAARFISVTPVLLRATAVPEPASCVALLVIVVGGVVRRRRAERRRA